MRQSLALAAAAVLAASAQAQSPEATREGAKRRFEGVITNDSLPEIIKNARVSLVGQPDAPGAPAKPAQAPSKSQGRLAPSTRSFTISVEAVCDNRLFVIPSWCPQPGPGVKGGLYREIEVSAGDRVELTLRVRDTTLYSHGFLLTSHKPETTCQPGPRSVDPVYETLSYGQSKTVSFVAETPGLYYYCDTIHASGFGIVRVK